MLSGDLQCAKTGPNDSLRVASCHRVFFLTFLVPEASPQLAQAEVPLNPS